MKEIKDLRGYLKELDKMAKGLSTEQTKQFRNIITSILVLLVALRKQSNLGEISFNWEEL